MPAANIKCVVWDLDNTIWDGILLEDEEVILKANIKEIVQELDGRGILQTICSKNDYSSAMEKLKTFGIDEYFLFPQIGWDAKSVAIKRLQERLRIGMDAIMFVDDQPFELDEVKSVHHDIMCFDAEHYQQLLSLSCLQPGFITQEARKRRQMYLEDVQRETDEQQFQGPAESFLRSLNLKFTISRAQEEDLRRVEELTVRTNQLNATGITYSFEELDNFRQSDQHLLLVCELTDKYGSYGKVGIALVEMHESVWLIKLLLMSCRVISRGVGTILLAYIIQQCKQEEKRLLADFRHTGKNRMMLVAYRFANFKEISSDEDGIIRMENDLTHVHPFPTHIQVVEIEEAKREKVNMHSSSLL